MFQNETQPVITVPEESPPLFPPSPENSSQNWLTVPSTEIENSELPPMLEPPSTRGRRPTIGHVHEHLILAPPLPKNGRKNDQSSVLSLLKKMLLELLLLELDFLICWKYSVFDVSVSISMHLD